MRYKINDLFAIIALLLCISANLKNPSLQKNAVFCGNPKIPPPLRVVMPHFPPPLRRGIKGVGKIIKNSCHCEIYAHFCHCEALKKPKQSTNFCHCENLRFCKKADSWQSIPNPSLRILAIARRSNLFMIFADLFLDCHKNLLCSFFSQ